MPIRPFLNGHSFDPETIKRMSIAFKSVCTDLRLSDKKDRTTEVVAKRVIELAAKAANDDPDQLREAVLASFKRGE